MFKLKLHWQIIIAIVLAIVIGLVVNAVYGQIVLSAIDVLGKLFLKALKMVVVPLIASSIIVSIAGIGSSGAVGRLGAMTLTYYMCTSLLAILIGLLFVNIITPGIIDGKPANEVVGKFKQDISDIQSKIEGKGMQDISELPLRMVPENVFAAASDNAQLLSIIVFSLLFGFFMTKIEGPYADTMYRFWRGVEQTMLKITDFIIMLAPIGVFALVFSVVVATGMTAFVAVIKFVLTVLLALGFHMFITMALILYFVARVNPKIQYQGMAPALLMAFSTSSSSATLPVTLECVEQNVGVSGRTSNFVLPLGATVNMDGTALYECVAALFIAQAYGIDMSMRQQFLIVVIALLTSVGVAGVPAASLVAISIILTSMGLPLEGIGLIMIADRILDMCRTAVNIFSDSCGATTIAKLSGEELKPQRGQESL